MRLFGNHGVTHPARVQRSPGLTCAGYLEYPFKKNKRYTDSNTLVRYLSCYHLEASFDTKDLLSDVDPVW